jgi:cytochrome c-type biogenesis protein CcmH
VSARAALTLVLAAGALAGSSAQGPSAFASHAGVAAPRASLPSVEREVMCVTCKIPLELAQSPQAERERAFIAKLIARGENDAQIKRALVAQYGPTVLALPAAHGFNLAVYLVPPLALIVVLGLLAPLLVRWRRAGGESAPGSPDAARADEVPRALSAEDAARVTADMSRYE